jgi:hypothetical protein
VPARVIENVSKKYIEIYKTITEKELPGNPSKAAPIKDYVGRYFSSLAKE